MAMADKSPQHQARGQRARTLVNASAPGIYLCPFIGSAAKAVVHSESAVFIAYNKSHDRRALHVLRFQDELSFEKERPYYVAVGDDFVQSGTISVLKLMLEKFGDEAVSMHLIVPWRNLLDFSNSRQLRKFKDDYFNLIPKLPAQPLNAGLWTLTPHKTKTVEVVHFPPAVYKYGPVFIDEKYIDFDRHDAGSSAHSDAGTPAEISLIDL